MRVAIIHYWLVGMRGGEKVLEELCGMYPGADIFTHVYDPQNTSEIIRRHRIVTTFINSLPAARKMYQNYLPLMPLALEQLNLQDYDLIISSESGPAKGIIAPPGAVHVCYCHTPMRYIWNMYHDYAASVGFVKRTLMAPVSHYLRMWDVISASRVDSFVANSKTVASRIRRYYAADATVIFPPVDVEAFSPVASEKLEDYFLMAGQLVRYKRPDLAVQAFNQMKRRLVVIGGGEMLDELRKIAGPTVSILGPQPFDVLREHYARCQALIFPGEEDFGIVPVEAMASGRPVIAYARGGATETVIPELSGLFFNDQSVASISDAVSTFDRMTFDSKSIVGHARNFSRGNFVEKMRSHIDAQLAHRGFTQR